MSSTYPITTSLKVIKELQYVKEITKGVTPTSPLFTAIPTAVFVPRLREVRTKYYKIGNPDLTKSLKHTINYDVGISYAPAPVTTDALLESMINLTGSNNRENSYTFLLSQQHNNAGTLAEQYQIARGCSISSLSIRANARGLVFVGSSWMALSVSDWALSHDLTGTPTFAPALTTVPWTANNTGTSPLKFIDLGPVGAGGLSYDVRAFSAMINHNTERISILDQLNTVRINPGVRDIEITVDIVYKDNKVSQSAKTITSQQIEMQLHADESVITVLTFSGVFLERYNETVDAEIKDAKVVSYSGTASAVSIYTIQTGFVNRALPIQSIPVSDTITILKLPRRIIKQKGESVAVSDTISILKLPRRITKTLSQSVATSEQVTATSTPSTATGDYVDENFDSNNFVLDT
jgi:hypothetical protein